MQRGADLFMEQASQSGEQQWQWSGKHLINVETGMPLQLGPKVYWSADVSEVVDWILR